VIENTYDLVGLIICTQIIQKIHLHYSKITTMFQNDYNEISRLVSQRIFELLDMHSQNFAKAAQNLDPTFLDYASDFLISYSYLISTCKLSQKFKNHLNNWLETIFMRFVNNLELNLPNKTLESLFIPPKMIYRLMQNLETQVTPSHCKIWPQMEKQILIKLNEPISSIIKERFGDVMSFTEKYRVLIDEEDIDVIRMLCNTIIVRIGMNWHEDLVSMLQKINNATFVDRGFKNKILETFKTSLMDLLKDFMKISQRLNLDVSLCFNEIVEFLDSGD